MTYPDNFIATVGGWAHGYASSVRYFWDDDILAMGQKLGALQKAVQMRQRKAKVLLEDFQAQRKAHVAEILEVKFFVVLVLLCHAAKHCFVRQHSMTATEWYTQFSKEQSFGADRVREKRIEE